MIHRPPPPSRRPRRPRVAVLSFAAQPRRAWWPELAFLAACLAAGTLIRLILA